jgi:hypothetical protein
MAGDWIKMSTDLRTHPKVVRIASALKADRLRVVGALHAVWCLFDAHSADGSLDGYTSESLDELVGWSGFSAAMKAVEWMEIDEVGLHLPGYETHNGASAKRRAQEAERKRESRISPQVVRNVSALDADGMRTREEKRREEKREEKDQLSLVPALPPDEAASDKASTKGIPDCPHQDVLALWAEMLPSLPQHLASQWRGSRADHLRARWRETATEKGWKDSKQGIEYFRKLFAYVGRSEFLTGRATQQGRRPFIVELEWLVSPSNWAKVHEGKYHGDAA